MSDKISKQHNQQQKTLEVTICPPVLSQFK